MLTACQRKQHRDTLEVVFSCFLMALGVPGFQTAQIKLPSAISHFLNDYHWSTRTLLRVMRSHALEAFLDYLRGRRGRPPMVEVRHHLHRQRGPICRFGWLDSQPQPGAWSACRHALHLLWRLAPSLELQNLAWVSARPRFATRSSASKRGLDPFSAGSLPWGCWIQQCQAP